MIKKYIKKLNILVAIMTIVFSLTPRASHASFFDWLGNYGSEPMNYSNSIISQRSLLYSNSIFNQKGSDNQSRILSVVQDTTIVQPSSILSVDPSTIKIIKATKKTMKVRVTAYSSTPDQTDSSPFITASGTRVRDGVIATNILPFKTLVKIPELFGDKVFVVEDRMNVRYTNVVDIWLPDRQSALNLGSKHATMEVVGSL